MGNNSRIVACGSVPTSYGKFTPDPRILLVRLIVFISILLISLRSTHAQVGTIVGGFVAALVARSTIDDAKAAANEVIDHLDVKVKERISQAVDESTRKAAREASDLLKQVRRDLMEIIDETFKKAKEEREAIFKQLAEERRVIFENVDRALGRLDIVANSVLRQAEEMANRLFDRTSQELDVVVMIIKDKELPSDLKTFVKNSVAEKKEAFGLYRFYGEGQPYRLDGWYQFVAVGKGFGRENGTPTPMKFRVDGRLQDEARQRVEREYIRTIEVPVKMLNASFRDTEPGKATLTFEGNLVKSTQQDILLFPKFPLRYEWTARMPDGKTLPVYVKIPGKDFLHTEEAVIRQRIADLDMDEAPARNDADQAVRERQYEILELMQKRLPLGAYEVELPAQWASWNLNVTWANGDRKTLHPTELMGRGVRVDPELTGSSYRRVRLSVELPK